MSLHSDIFFTPKIVIFPCLNTYYLNQNQDYQPHKPTSRFTKHRHASGKNGGTDSGSALWHKI